jgi:hypothetical protein
MSSSIGTDLAVGCYGYIDSTIQCNDGVMAATMDQNSLTLANNKTIFFRFLNGKVCLQYTFSI